MPTAIPFLTAFLLAFPLGTLVEYVLHRWVLHARSRSFFARRHRMHHKEYDADTVWADFRDFSVGGLPFFWFGFLHSVPAGLGLLFGGLAYVLLLAAVHKFSHEQPRLVFWMTPNSHELHHGVTPRQNFGIVTRFWDRVFGTFADSPPTRRSTGKAVRHG